MEEVANESDSPDDCQDTECEAIVGASSRHYARPMDGISRRAIHYAQVRLERPQVPGGPRSKISASTDALYRYRRHWRRNRPEHGASRALHVLDHDLARRRGGASARP